MDLPYFFSDVLYLVRTPPALPTLHKHGMTLNNDIVNADFLQAGSD